MLAPDQLNALPADQMWTGLPADRKWSDLPVDHRLIVLLAAHRLPLLQAAVVRKRRDLTVAVDQAMTDQTILHDLGETPGLAALTEVGQAEAVLIALTTDPVEVALTDQVIGQAPEAVVLLIEALLPEVVVVQDLPHGPEGTEDKQ